MELEKRIQNLKRQGKAKQKQAKEDKYYDDLEKKVKEIVVYLPKNKLERLSRRIDEVQKIAQREPTAEELLDIFNEYGLDVENHKHEDYAQAGHKHEEFLTSEEYRKRQEVFAKEAMRLISNVQIEIKKIDSVEKHLLSLVEEKTKLEKELGREIAKVDAKILRVRQQMKKKAAKKDYVTKKYVLDLLNKLQYQLGSRGGGNVTVSRTPPRHPNLHQLWVDIS